MEEREIEGVFAIPANYTDSGKILGGMISIRNAIEAIILVALVGYAEYALIPMFGTIRIIVMAVSLIPLAILAMIGVNGDSLFTFIGYMILFLFKRKKLHYRRFDFEEKKK